MADEHVIVVLHLLLEYRALNTGVNGQVRPRRLPRSSSTHWRLVHWQHSISGQKESQHGRCQVTAIVKGGEQCEDCRMAYGV